MNDSDRFKLYFGPYATPRFKYGQTVWCEFRGWTKIVGLSDGKIPWPIGRPTTPNPGRDSLIVFRGQKKAIEKEANQAVAHWWGVSMGAVSRWRGALGVRRKTPGTERTFDAALKAESRRAKMSKIGEPRSQHVLDAMRKAHLGKPIDDATRKKMSESHRKRGTRPPWLNKAWEPWEDKLVRKLPVEEVMKKTGRSRKAVHSRRHRLKLPDGRTKASRKKSGTSK